MPIKPTINYEDFTKLDMRMGCIVAAEPVTDSKKLLKLTVDFGEFKRQIISGIAQFYTPDTLIGKQCIFIVNLEPRMMAGLESQGMLVATDLNNKPILLNPEEAVLNGSIIH